MNIITVESNPFRSFSSMEKMLSDRITKDVDRYFSSHNGVSSQTLGNLLKNNLEYRVKEMGFSITGDISCTEQQDCYCLVADSPDLGKIVLYVDNPLQKSLELFDEQEPAYIL